MYLARLWSVLEIWKGYLVKVGGRAVIIASGSVIATRQPLGGRDV
jgi:hypothetical protein